VNGFSLGLSLLVLVAFVLSGYRELAGLGPVSGMNDACAWGIWKTFNLMVLTALGSGAFAVGIAAWVFRRKRLSPMKKALIGGIGNVLLGDDGVGPYVVRLLESMYAFEQGVEVADLGTPALDLTHQIVGLHALILVDSVASDDPPGTITRYRKEDILRDTPAQRLDPHSPALAECLMTAAMLGAMPQHVLLVGISGNSDEPGQPLNAAVRQSVGPAMDAVLQELHRLDFAFQKKLSPDEAGIWWSDRPNSSPVETRG
jgi:hydrogenase maturation protease